MRRRVPDELPERGDQQLGVAEALGHGRGVEKVVRCSGMPAWCYAVPRSTRRRHSSRPSGARRPPTSSRASENQLTASRGTKRVERGLTGPPGVVQRLADVGRTRRRQPMTGQRRQSIGVVGHLLEGLGHTLVRLRRHVAPRSW